MKSYRMLQQRFKTIYSLIFLFWLTTFNAVIANDKVTDEFNDFTYSIVQIEINKVVLDDYIDSYNTIYNHYFSLSGLTNTLGFDITYDLFAPMANGWMYKQDNLFIFNGETQTLSIGKQEYKLEDSDFVFYQNEIFITIDVFAKIMDMQFIYKANELLLVLISKQITPAEQKALLQRKYQNLKRRSEQKDQDLIKIPADIQESYEKFTIPMFEFNIDLDYESGTSDYNGSDSQNNYANQLSGDVEFYARNHFLYMDTVYYRNHDLDDGKKSELLTFSKTDYDGLIGRLKATQFEFGDVINNAGDGVGFEISNKSKYSGYGTDNLVITGESFEGWRVELFVNEKYIDFQIVGSDGRYSFDDVSLNKQDNVVEIIQYGPYGEIERDSRQYKLSSDLLKSNELYYDIQYVKNNKNLLSNSTNNRFSDETDNHYLRIGRRLTDNKSLYYINTKDDFSNINQLSLIQQKQGFLNYYNLSQDTTADTRTFSLLSYFTFSEKEIDGNFSYTITDGNGLNHSILLDYSKDYTKFTYDLATSFADIFDDFTSSIDLKTNYRYDNCLRSYHNISFDDDQVDVELSIRCVRTGSWFGSSIDFAVTPDTKFNNSDIQYHKRFDEKLSYDFTLSFERNSDSSSYDIKNKLLYKIVRSIRAGFYIDHYKENTETVYGLTLNASGISTLVYNPYSKTKYSFINDTDSAKGMLGIRSYIDNNYNDIFDTGDELLTNIKYQAVGTLAKENASGGIVFYKSLSSTNIYPIMVDYRFLDDVDLSATKEVIRIQIVPSKINYIDYMFVYYGLIDGNLYIGDKSVPGSKILLIDSDGNTVSEYVTESDGYFYFEKVPIGEYTLQLSDTTISRLEITENINYSVSVLKDQLFIEYLEVNILGLTSKKVEDFFLGVKEPEVTVVPEVEVVEEKAIVAKPVNISLFNIKPIAKPVEQAILFDPNKNLAAKAKLFHPLAKLGDETQKVDFKADKEITAISLPDSEMIYGDDNDDYGMFEVEVAESQKKGEIISYMIDFNRTYPQIFAILNMKIRMQDKSKEFKYKLKTEFADKASEAISYCEKLANTKAKCVVEKETKIVGKFASKQDAFNYKTKMALEGALEDKEAHIRKIDEESEVEISNINIQQSKLNKDQLLKEYITYLGGVSYELLISSDNMFDNSVENFCNKYSNVLDCETKYITSHGTSEFRRDLRRSGLTKKTVIDIYDQDLDDNIWYLLTTGEFKDIDESLDFCNSLGIVDERCVIYEREQSSIMFRAP